MHPTTDANHSQLVPSLGGGHAGRSGSVPVAAAMREHTPFSFGTPPSLGCFIAAVLEPGIVAVNWLAVHLVWDEPFTRASMVLLLLALTVSYPGSARFHDSPTTSATRIVAAWLWLLGFLAMCAFALDGWQEFELDMVLAWAISTPIVRWLSVLAGHGLFAIGSFAGGRRAIIVGAGPLAARTRRELVARPDARTEVIGCFDDRRTDRLDPDMAGAVRGSLWGDRTAY